MRASAYLLASRVLWFVLVLALAPAAPPSAATAPVVVVWTSGIKPFEEAINGIRTGFGDAVAMDFVDLKSPSAQLQLEAAQQAPGQLTIAVGMDALSAVSAHRSGGPILATMVLRSDAASTVAGLGSSRRFGAVYLDVSLSYVMAELKILFPGKNRLGIVYNPSRINVPVPELLAQARQQSFIAEVRECAGPETLLRTFLSLKRKADFVLLRPDSSLYNDATAPPLLLASLENELPIIAFSASFVRAGAALGVYPDFQDVGLQTATAGRRYLASPSTLGEETPRRFNVAVNQRVLRLFGLAYFDKPEHPLVVLK